MWWRAAPPALAAVPVALATAFPWRPAPGRHRAELQRRLAGRRTAPQGAGARQTVPVTRTSTTRGLQCAASVRSPGHGTTALCGAASCAVAASRAPRRARGTAAERGRRRPPAHAGAGHRAQGRLREGAEALARAPWGGELWRTLDAGSLTAATARRRAGAAPALFLAYGLGCGLAAAGAAAFNMLWLGGPATGRREVRRQPPLRAVYARTQRCRRSAPLHASARSGGGQRSLVRACGPRPRDSRAELREGAGPPPRPLRPRRRRERASSFAAAVEPTPPQLLAAAGAKAQLPVRAAAPPRPAEGSPTRANRSGARGIVVCARVVVEVAGRPPRTRPRWTTCTCWPLTSSRWRGPPVRARTARARA